MITINKELTDFFNDPERKNLKGWQVFVFSALGVVGLALGAILLIAVSGLHRTRDANRDFDGRRIYWIALLALSVVRWRFLGWREAKLAYWRHIQTA